MGGPRFGKNSHIFPFFFWATSLMDVAVKNLLCLMFSAVELVMLNSWFSGLVHLIRWNAAPMPLMVQPLSLTSGSNLVTLLSNEYNS